MHRAQVIATLAERLATITREHPVRVGIDGLSCSGKTTLADELVAPLEARGRPTLRAGVDGFHNPPEVRKRQGDPSPQGYYEDSFDYAAIHSCVLRPLGPGGDRRYRPAQYDFRRGEAVVGAWQQAVPQAILLFEGVFLQRPELAGGFDYVLYVHIGFGEMRRRARERDRKRFGSLAEVERRYRQRYIPGQLRYLQRCAPLTRADLVVINDDVAHPELRG